MSIDHMENLEGLISCQKNVIDCQDKIIVRLKDMLKAQGMSNQLITQCLKGKKTVEEVSRVLQ